MESGFFEDLMSTKREIGFPVFKNENKIDKKKRGKGKEGGKGGKRVNTEEEQINSVKKK